MSDRQDAGAIAMTDTPSMLERLAETIDPDAWRSFHNRTFDVEKSARFREEALDTARACIQALMEPSEGVLAEMLNCYGGPMLKVTADEMHTVKWKRILKVVLEGK